MFSKSVHQRMWFTKFGQSNGQTLSRGRIILLWCRDYAEIACFIGTFQLFFWDEWNQFDRKKWKQLKKDVINPLNLMKFYSIKLIANQNSLLYLYELTVYIFYFLAIKICDRMTMDFLAKQNSHCPKREDTNSSTINMNW